MKYALIIFCSSIMIYACSTDTSGEASSESQSTNNVEGKNTPLMETDAKGLTTEYYPGSKIRKAQGKLDEEGKRHGIWYGYDKNGFRSSQADYHHGLKNGVSIVYRPNGKIFYTGEYRNDKQIGVWSYYDENGNLDQTQNFSE